MDNRFVVSLFQCVTVYSTGLRVLVNRRISRNLDFPTLTWTWTYTRYSTRHVRSLTLALPLPLAQAMAPPMAMAMALASSGLSLFLYPSIRPLLHRLQTPDLRLPDLCACLAASCLLAPCTSNTVLYEYSTAACSVIVLPRPRRNLTRQTPPASIRHNSNLT